MQQQALMCSIYEGMSAGLAEKGLDASAIVPITPWFHGLRGFDDDDVDDDGQGLQEQRAVSDCPSERAPHDAPGQCHNLPQQHCVGAVWPKRYVDMRPAFPEGAVRLLVVPLEDCPSLAAAGAAAASRIAALLPTGTKVCVWWWWW
jgi:hypothetical protein